MYVSLPVLWHSIRASPVRSGSLGCSGFVAGNFFSMERNRRTAATGAGDPRVRARESPTRNSRIWPLFLEYVGQDPMLCFERVADAPKHDNTRLTLGPNHKNTKTRTAAPGAKAWRGWSATQRSLSRWGQRLSDLFHKLRTSSVRQHYVAYMPYIAMAARP